MSYESKRANYDWPKAIPVGVDQDGAVDLDTCPHTGTRWPFCACGLCAVCDEHKHMAIHGPLHGQPPGSRPWGHRFVAKPQAPRAGETR